MGLAMESLLLPQILMFRSQKREVLSSSRNENVSTCLQHFSFCSQSDFWNFHPHLPTS